MLTLTDAVNDLHRLAVTEGKRQATTRMGKFADLCVQELAERGIVGAGREITVPGIGRSKRWDVAWSHGDKVRLGISLKSMLRNISGAVPNRVDDLMGEMANVQLYSPEIVTGYVMVFDANAKKQDGKRWVDVFRSYVCPLSGRKAPAWSPGTVEALAIVEVDFSASPKLITPNNLDKFFDLLAERLKERNPNMGKPSDTKSNLN